MKFSLPYTSDIKEYLDGLSSENLSQINDLYFSDPNFNPSARYFPDVDIDKTWEELISIRESHGVHMQYVMNSSVWKNDVYTTGKSQIIDNVNEIYNRGCTMLTINNMFLLRDVEFRKNIPEDLILKVSINNKVSTLEEVEFLYRYSAVTHFILDRSVNRNLDEIKRIHNWRKDKNITLTLLGQEGCLTKCPWKSTCDNMIATFADYDIHEVNDLKAHHSSHFCTVHYNNHPADQLKSPWISPTAVGIYDEFVDYIKLAGRMNPISTLSKSIDGYLNRSGEVNISDVLTMSGETALSRCTVSDLEIHGFSSQVSNCRNRCSDCDFCDRLYVKINNEN